MCHPATIGQATLAPDGTVILDLRAQGSGALGDAQFRYPPGHPEREGVLRHLGGLAPGEVKPVPPWEFGRTFNPP
ncbi:MAG: hypothetical protein HY823_13775 [Acidobacteria bacterium]|nr:hypothetical protein [Acidobacteriota bacterium]